MVVPSKAVYIPAVLTSEGGIGADTREYTTATVVSANMAVVT